MSSSDSIERFGFCWLFLFFRSWILVVFWQVLYISSSILTAICFGLFAIYSVLWLKQPEYEWMAPLLFAAIIFFSCMGLLPIPYIMVYEIFPKEAHLNDFVLLFDFILLMNVLFRFRLAKYRLRWQFQRHGSLILHLLTRCRYF